MRKRRLEYLGAYYHVIARGNRRQRVFLEAGDYVRYLKCLGETLGERDFKLYAYCLMGNHIHLFLQQCSEWPLSRVMQRLQTAYTYFFNKKHNKVGHLFQGRYKSIVVDSDAYFLQLVRYIHLNPWRAKMEEALGKYPWTSHGQYLREEQSPLASVQVDAVLRMFSRIGAVARKRYRAYLLEGQDEGHREDLYDLRLGRILGDEEFEAQVHRESSSGHQAAMKISKTVDQLWKALLDREGLKEEPVKWERSRLIGEAVYWMVEYGRTKQTEMADYFKMRPTAINEALRRHRVALKLDSAGKQEKERWARSL